MIIRTDVAVERSLLKVLNMRAHWVGKGGLPLCLQLFEVLLVALFEVVLVPAKAGHAFDCPLKELLLLPVKGIGPVVPCCDWQGWIKAPDKSVERLVVGPSGHKPR